jgi:hypothetical protein
MNGNWDHKNKAGIEVTLTQDGVEKETLHIESLSMRPGSKVESVASVTCQADGNFSFKISFLQTEESPLKDYVNVSIKVEDELLGEYALWELLDGQTMQFTRSVVAGEDFQILLVYKMPIEVDDAAQGLAAKFIVELEAGNKS